MPKQLLLVRHAKSDWDNAKLSDFDRPLNTRGEKSAPEMANRLLKKRLIPEQLVSSPALRALSTARLFAKELGIEKSLILTEPEIYEALTSTLMAVINDLDNHSSFTALFGHNPGITSVVSNLCNNDLVNIPTCGMVLIEFPFDDWSMVSAGTGDLIFYDYPKNGQD
ncbi:SixA phosphatase family protein [Daejeonella lutea]|uniref:Phosphohistidine phosphatase n=1 Tax=Daejeonella lutea TaxID=572036 RepID=A0A1T5AVH1_9SPHI|nr:histidine phosphatase family protein [Daejeonella lutea]SKB38809.1 phosphohistidine phosphatase [Daejeonella lutea]